jgi:hypothetical protein
MPEFALDYHRRKVPIDHPDLSVTRGKLEYPTVDVCFSYLSAINKVKYVSYRVYSYGLITFDTFTDKAIWQAVQVNQYPIGLARLQDKDNCYCSQYDPTAYTSDHALVKIVGGTSSYIATESIDIDYSGRGLGTSCSGSTIKSLRYELPSPINPLALPTANATISATDTAFASGYIGFLHLRYTYPHGGASVGSAWLKAPLTLLPQAQSILEVDIEGSGKPEDTFRPSLSKNLIEVSTDLNILDFLLMEKKRYDMLKVKGFTDDEIKLLLGYIPQHQVDVNSVTWGAFEFSEKSPTNIIMVYGDNPYNSGAIQRQIDYAKSRNLRVFTPPKDYNDAVSLYNRLKGDFKHWLAGKDNFAYQVLGWEVLDWLQNVDLYYGELIEHKTHYDQLKSVPDWELRNRFNELKDKLSRVNVLIDERDKHLGKLNEILKRGW